MAITSREQRAVRPLLGGCQGSRLVQDQIGAAFNVHLVRQLMVTLLLETDSRNMVVAQRMLGHGALKTTGRHYGGSRGRGVPIGSGRRPSGAR